MALILGNLDKERVHALNRDLTGVEGGGGGVGRRGILEPEKVCPVQRGEVLALSVQWSMTEVHWSQMAWFSQQGLVPSPQRPRAQQMSDGRMSVVS